MITNLSPVGYSFDEVRKIWSRPAFVGIPYTDGDEVEQRIARIVSESEDVSVLSDELRRKITDWPSLYHLSRSRANLLRPFEARLGAGVDVLEVGAGCGAITRFLGECGANILALEGSLRRAEIASSRTRDLQNVTILADQFEQFEITNKFDVVTLIGVLEYADVFASGADATLAVLRKAKFA